MTDTTSLHEETKRFLEHGFVEGDLIPKGYFWELFGMIEPAGYMHAKEVQKINLRFMSKMDALRENLLDAELDLENLRGKGYRLIPFNERVDAAWNDGRRQITKAARKTKRRIKAIPHQEQLNYEQRRIRDFALTTIDIVVNVVRKKQLKD